MTVLVDPPLWPAHDRLWSHLVSDVSLHELRTFARAADLPDRAFDVDHYDVPAERIADLVAAGAVPVDGGELSRRLAASGLRVPGHERSRAKRPTLRQRWAGLWSDGALGAEQVAAVGEDLIDRWAEPHRVYHSRLHLADTLDALEKLSPAAGTDGTARVAALALWFHDAVHDGVAGDDEERSAALARELLPAGPQAAEVARLVLLTAGHDPDPDDVTGCLVSDADLAILGGTPARYARYVAQVRAEYSHVGDDDFRAGRAAVLAQLLALHAGPGLYRTPAARERWADAAERNLRRELASLTGR
ncbi:hypothetical protein GCM10023216_31190 [Isoptericola chiayiensis]|uniref:DUF4031 domain-containing protein n=1 Tax=Isoptericola chiayiensis TaxID=579446 RepID=A0ABP8YRF2_9MICO|nr:putative metal-dependent HD superfamily phosphohydrolase [Isoptericola chiayiensis]